MLCTVFHRPIPASRKLRMLAAAIAALALSACGGGGSSVSGGGSSVNDGGGSSVRGGAAGPAPIPPVAYANVAPKAAQTAATAPVFGRQGAVYRMYGDHLTIFMTSAGVSPLFDGANFQFPPVDVYTRSSAPGRLVTEVGFPAADANLIVVFNNVEDDEWRETRRQDTVGSLTRFRIDAISNDLVETFLEDERGMVANIVLFTDYDLTADGNDDGTVGDDTDFMAIAVWDMGPHGKDDPRGSLKTVAGAAATGRVPYTGLDSGHDSLTAVTYSGTAAGKRFSGGTVTDFTTTVSLTANFSATATISGTLGDVGGGQKLELQSASIDRGSDGGPFSGNTQLVGDDGNNIAGFTGKWGGAFFGATDATNGPPGTAGTFGATGGDPSDTVLGAFITHRQ